MIKQSGTLHHNLTDPRYFPQIYVTPVRNKFKCIKLYLNTLNVLKSNTLYMLYI